MLAIGLAAVLLAGCGRAVAPRQVNLTRVDPTVTARPVVGPSQVPLRVAAASLVSPQETMRSYGAFFAYVGKQIGRPVELVQSRTYQETYDLLHYGTIDLGLVCTYVYIKGQKEFGLELVAAPAVKGKAEYHSLIIVRADSSLQTFADLAGKRFAFTDPLSNSGRMYPLALLRESGTEPGSFFSATVYTYSHDNSIKAVLQGMVDGAAVDSLVYDQTVARNPALADKLRVIGRSQAFASPPFVTGHGVSRELKEQLQRVLLQMHEDPEGQALLANLGVDRFVVVTDADFQSVREIAARAGAAP